MDENRYNIDYVPEGPGMEENRCDVHDVAEGRSA